MYILVEFNKKGNLIFNSAGLVWPDAETIYMSLTSCIGNYIILKALVCLFTLDSRTLVQKMPMKT